MERTLVLVRHAKSDWAISGQPDVERSLNARGKRDAPEMGKRLKKKQLIPDVILSSPATRAAMTAKLVAAELGFDPAKIQWVGKLYHCPAETFEEVITGAGMADDVQTVLVFAHNPGITQFALDMLPDIRITDMPTCAMVALTFNAAHWDDFARATRHFLFFDYPKNQ